MQFPIQNVAVFVSNLVPKFNYGLYSDGMEFHLVNGSERLSASTKVGLFVAHRALPFYL